MVSLDIFHLNSQHGQIYSVHKHAGGNLTTGRMKFRSGKCRSICGAEQGLACVRGSALP